MLDCINEMRRAHRGVGRQEALNNVLQLKPDMRGGLSDSDEGGGGMERFSRTFDKRYTQFRKRNQFPIRRRTRVGQTFPVSCEGSAWATLMKVRPNNKTQDSPDLRQTFGGRGACAWSECAYD